MIDLSTIYGTGGSNRGKPIVSGRNGAVGTSYESLDAFNIDRDQFSIFAGTAAKIDVSSSSTADAAASTGALTVALYGLSASYQPISETITMNGQTAVTSALSYLRLHGAKVLTAGTGRVNAGDIYCIVTASSTWTSGVPDTLTSALVKILVGAGCNMSGCWTSPPFVQTAFKQITVGARGDSGTFAVFMRPLSGAANTQIKYAMYETDCFTGTNQLDCSLFPTIPPLTDVVFRFKAGSGTALVTVDAFLAKV